MANWRDPSVARKWKGSDEGWKSWNTFKGQVYLCGHGEHDIKQVIDYSDVKAIKEAVEAARKARGINQDKKDPDPALGKDKKDQIPDIDAFFTVPPKTTITLPYAFGRVIVSDHVKLLLTGKFEAEKQVVDRVFKAGQQCPNLWLVKETTAGEVSESYKWLSQNPKYELINEEDVSEIRILNCNQFGLERLSLEEIATALPGNDFVWSCCQSLTGKGARKQIEKQAAEKAGLSAEEKKQKEEAAAQDKLKAKDPPSALFLHQGTEKWTVKRFLEGLPKLPADIKGTLLDAVAIFDEFRTMIGKDNNHPAAAGRGGYGLQDYAKSNIVKRRGTELSREDKQNKVGGLLAAGSPAGMKSGNDPKPGTALLDRAIWLSNKNLKAAAEISELKQYKEELIGIKKHLVFTLLGLASIETRNAIKAALKSPDWNKVQGLSKPDSIAALNELIDKLNESTVEKKIMFLEIVAKEKEVTAAIASIAEPEKTTLKTVAGIFTDYRAMLELVTVTFRLPILQNTARKTLAELVGKDRVEPETVEKIENQVGGSAAAASPSGPKSGSKDKPGLLDRALWLNQDAVATLAAHASLTAYREELQDIRAHLIDTLLPLCSLVDLAELQKGRTQAKPSPEAWLEEEAISDVLKKKLVNVSVVDDAGLVAALTNKRVAEGKDFAKAKIAARLIKALPDASLMELAKLQLGLLGGRFVEVEGFSKKTLAALITKKASNAGDKKELEKALKEKSFLESSGLSSATFADLTSPK